MSPSLTIVAEFVALPFECPACGGEGSRTQCAPSCDGSHIFDRDAFCSRCDGRGVVAFLDPRDEDIPALAA